MGSNPTGSTVNAHLLELVYRLVLETSVVRHEGSIPSVGTMKKIIVRHKDFTLKVHISEDCTTIYDSYQVKSPCDMKSIIYSIKSETSSEYAVNKRSISDMIREWRVHNLLYSLNI